MGASFTATARSSSSIRCRISGLSVVNYDRQFIIKCEDTGETSTYYRYSGESSNISTTFSNLSSGTWYDFSVVCYNIDKSPKEVVWRDSDSAKTEEEPVPVDPVVITSASVSPRTITSGGQITISWRYSGDKDSSGSWYLYRTDSSSFTNPTGIGNPAQSASSFTMNWGPTGTYYIWVRYYGSSQGWSTVKSAGSITVNAPTYTVTVISYTNGSEYDRGTFSITGGSSISALTAWQRSGIDTDGDFSYWTFNGGSSISDMSETRTVNANSTVRIYFTKITHSEVNFNTFLDGSLYDAKTESFAAQSHTYQFWLNSFKNNYGLRIPSGDFVDIYNGSTKVSLSSTLSVDGVHNAVVNVYYETHRAKTYIYDNNTWKPATPYIWNGSTWVEAEPNIFDGGWK